MKKVFFAALCVLAFTASCKDGKKSQLIAEQQRDSLERIISQKDYEINDMMSTLNDIEEGFRSINEAQGRVTVAKRGEGASATARIQENMQFIAQAMQQNRELINKLREQVRQSTVKGDQLKRTIENLTTQLAEKEEMLVQLRAELDAKDIHIAELDETIASLNADVNKLEEEGVQKSRTISKQDKELNAAWFVYGTKKELSDKNIRTKKFLGSKKVLEGDVDLSYFTKIDIRVDKEIKFYSKKAEIETKHPAGTYTLERDANRQYVLRITDPQKFWSISKFLVVVVD